MPAAVAAQLESKTRETVAARTPEQIRRALHLGLLSANCEPERAVLRCALNLLNGAESFEIDPVSGVARTVAGFERAAASWAEQYDWYDRGDSPDTNPFRHDLAMEGRQVQARYAVVHPHLAEPVWFPDHGPRSCAFCLMAANEASGLSAETGMDPATGGVAQPGLRLIVGELADA
jgi:hypothetical protein